MSTEEERGLRDIDFAMISWNSISKAIKQKYWIKMEIGIHTLGDQGDLPPVFWTGYFWKIPV